MILILCVLWFPRVPHENANHMFIICDLSLMRAEEGEKKRLILNSFTAVKQLQTPFKHQKKIKNLSASDKIYRAADMERAKAGLCAAV